MHGPSSKSLHCKPYPQCVPRHTSGGSVTNRPDHVVRKHPRSAKMQGLLGKPQVAQYADLAFRLKTDKGQAIVLRLRKPGLFLPEAKEILLAHQDLEDDDFRVNYHTGKMHTPGGHAVTMIKSGAVWQIPVMQPPKHTVLAATTTAHVATTCLVSITIQDIERIHEVLCCAGATTMLRYYKHYHSTGFGKASTAAVRNFRCPIKTFMQGDANPKRRRTQDPQTESTPQTPPADTTDVHAHAAHSDAEDDVCACCADQLSKCVQFTATEPWPTLRGSASEPPVLECRKGLTRTNSIRRRKPDRSLADHHGQTPDDCVNGGRPLAQGKWWQTSDSGGSYKRSVCTTISSGGASSGGASPGGASPGGSSPKGANMDHNASSLYRHVPQGGRHPQTSCGTA
jgi:hypothetical protein